MVEEEKIVCLGLTFDTEEQRREYFRNKLRIRLPELKKIEGFPIGDDEDIIRLSDPPYYTACPNPWVNDFIAEWEKEKKTIKSRIADFKVDEPYASDVSEGKSNPIYTAHTYHTKVPHPAIMRYLLYYTQPGDSVLDSFSGTGMTGVAAQICENPDSETKYKIEHEWKQLFGRLPVWGQRKAICGDLSPYASLISYNYNMPADLELVDAESQALLNDVIKECTWLYETKHTDGGVGTINYTVWSDIFNCKSCSQEIVFWDAAMNMEKKELLDDFICPNCKSINNKTSAEKTWVTFFDTELGKTIRIAKSEPVLIVYTYKGKRFQKQPDLKDKKLIKEINELKISTWVPTYELPKGFNLDQPKKSHGVNNTHLFYTKRNLVALSYLNNRIDSSKLPNKLKFILTGMINRSTQMNRLHVSNFFYGGGGWNVGHLKGTLYIPSLQIETSILEQIQDKINSLKKAALLLGKQYSNLQFVGSASNTSIKDNSIDYVFTDPPFGANIMYSELNFLPETWLKVLTNNIKEAIENKTQGKSLLDYQSLMTECFKEYNRVLKPGKWMTVEFSNTSAAVWNGIQTALQRAGFIIANVAALDKKQGGMRGIVTATAVRQDLAISCYKPTAEFEQKFQNAQGSTLVWDFVEAHLCHLPVHLVRKDSTTSIIERSSKILFDRVITFYLMRALPVPIDARDFQEGLKQRFAERDEMFFTSAQVAEYDEKKARSPQFVQWSLIVTNESDAIEWLKERLRRATQKYQDIMPEFRMATQSLRKGDTLPELQDLLNESFIQDEQGRWRTPDPSEAKDRDALRNKVLLKEFNGYVSTISQPKAKKLKEVRVEAMRCGFKNCWERKDFKTIVTLGDMIPQNILLEDEQLLMYYDIAKDRV
ncbi:DNA methylase [Mucilaginibacter gossypiicola]|uniref:DNA methylase n=1 Tax=Mucilaginibacter gossypiicola TaxID=551995 RepID=A0A1H8D9F9_9SPHI|nr:DNA methyltransferase [Mucilaginibacter gossypiicola]SEN03923.1 DNA methylase [Mucilaginibacter gossypiicola]